MVSKEVHTAAIKTVYPKDVITVHLGGSANGYIRVRNGNDGWLPVP